MKTKFYSLKSILERDAHYNIIFGERSNGKTYAVLKYFIEQQWKGNGDFAIIRRWSDDFKGKRGATMFSALENNGEIKRITKGVWDRVYYYSSRWYYAKWDDTLNKIVRNDEPFAYAFSISTMEHDKSSSYPTINNIVFDEFLTRKTYLNDEFVLFMNTLSTIIRYRTDVKIFMLGNTVNKYSPYFAEMGLKNIQKMNKGDIDVYYYGQTDLKVAVEYADSPNKGKPSDLYFAFDNPKLNMITGGVWEIDIYPHLPIKYNITDIIFSYFIQFDGDTLQCDIIQKDESIFTYVHIKTTEIKNIERDLVYTPKYSHRPNFKRKITKPTSKIEKKIAELFVKEKVFYQDNEVGEIMRNYLQWCKSDAIK